MAIPLLVRRNASNTRLQKKNSFHLFLVMMLLYSQESFPSTVRCYQPSARNSEKESFRAAMTLGLLCFVRNYLLTLISSIIRKTHQKKFSPNSSGIRLDNL
ncbi:hypothetical protein BDF20DRAFT_851576 [Mycotypha africana]|uniref:uncharacterized protein n=1 Tax=Mycotypha africana TaxID=64632 RepID=UPI0023000807|nr:uncharacterized protein BDF20DRAFT_851576 [Mycotypha africana]KAI8987674.1 hypothetical protein BDF20DRAFT_851576 [Mycotypha africana]